MTTCSGFQNIKKINEAIIANKFVINVEINWYLVFSKALRTLIPTRLIESGIAPRAKAASTRPRYSALFSSMPKKSDFPIKVPNVKNTKVAGTAMIATHLRACRISERSSSFLLSITNLESLGRIAVTIEMVAIECGNIKIK